MTKNDCAPRPPMGWNSWDCYAATVTEAELLANAAYMRDHLKSAGWEYIVCDAEWFEPTAGTGEHEYLPFPEFCVDEYSRFIPAPNRFPSSAKGNGFKPIADQIHGMGLKFGIHIMRGIPRQAAHRRTPIKATLNGKQITADQIADPHSISRWNPDMYGVKADVPGAQEYYDSLFELYGSWGIDYVKVDDICNTNMWPHKPYSGRAEIEMIRRAIDKCGRPIVLSLSPGPALIDESWHLSQNANMWRITDDFWDIWPYLLGMFRRCEIWQAHVKPGNWPDCDMLPLGHIGLRFNSDIVIDGVHIKVGDRTTRFSKDEQRTMMTLWCIFRSPLMMGGVLPDCDDWTLSLLANREVIDVNQNGTAPRQICRDETQAIWVSDAGGGALNIALFNLSEERRTISCPLSKLQLPGAEVRSKTDKLGMTKARVRDLWAQKDIGTSADTVTAELAPHASALYKVC